MTGRRGVIALVPDACTSCQICAQECPAWCITVESHAEQVSEQGARRPRTVSVLDRFAIDFGLCMYCGICVDVCPFDALEWRPAVDYAAQTRADLVQDTQRLTDWRTDD
jgi:NADH-quinone oxidoreductase subunit I